MRSALHLPIITYIYDRYKHASPSRKATVELRIAYDCRQKYISTYIQLYPKEWDRRNRRVINRVDAAIINRTLDKLMMDVREVIYEMLNEGNIDIFSIPARLQAAKMKQSTFLQYYKEKATIRKHGLGKITQGRYDLVLRVLEDFGKITSFSDLNDRNIISFDKFLARRGVQAASRYQNYHKFLIRFIRVAKQEGLITNNPYDSIRLERGDYSRSLDKCLSIDEVRQLQSATLPARLDRVRDLFVFQCYTCLSYTDLAKFNPKNIEVIDGKQLYCGYRGKTKIRYTIPLLPPALAVLEKYNNKLPIISNVQYNKFLKEVSNEVGLEKHLTTHWARHTGATLLLNAGVAMEIVSKVCGHSTSKITEQIYAKMLPKTVLAEVNKKKKKLI